MKIPTPDDLAKELLSVQPMPSDCFKGIIELSKTEEELKAEGYKPVSRMGLMWVKDENG
jgi:hypothetical protein